MNDFAKVQNEDGLVRDRNSKAILSVDLPAKEAFMKERDQVLSFINIQAKLDLIQTDMQEIKTMLKGLSKIKCNYTL